MLKHMGQTGIVRGPGEERQVEDPVGVLVGDVHQLRAGLLMLKEHAVRADQGEFADFQHFKAADHIAHLGQALGRLFSRHGFRQAGDDAEQHDQRQRQRQEFLHGVPSLDR